MPRLHRAKTVAWGLLKWGRCAWMVCVHSVTRGWQDILFLLGCMGYMATHTTPAGRHVLPLCIAGRNIIDSKTYPRKGGSRGCAAEESAHKVRLNFLSASLRCSRSRSSSARRQYLLLDSGSGPKYIHRSSS